ncbi:uncharacterized protein LOC128245519 isoform X2 [Mya arenaria]|uniref:uncharacterized protein LOC128245519 isoform X2 n=1 Tax=Mya arenaria TaxID=6604 RepID=UPI0022E42433|nr:uncharacterized protein LOC128245519 isoform X2 [Mya arenaria]
MDGLSIQNVTCQVFNAAVETPYEVHGILCNVEKDNWPMLTVPEVLDGESSTTICEVRDAIPAPLIEIRVGNVLLSDVQQTDSFYEISHTFTSIATVTKTNRDWNGKEMCCVRKCKADFGLKDVSVCKNISFRYVPTLYLNTTSPVVLHPNITVTVKCFVDDMNNLGQWNLWWENENSTEIEACIKAEECLLTLNYTGNGDKTYICNAWKSNELLRNSLTVSSSMTDEATTNPELVVPQQWHLVLYVVAGILLVYL